MADVFLGVDRADPSRLVALKVLKDVYAMNTEVVTMFTDEAKLVSQLHHPNIVEVIELGAQGTRLFMAMEFLHGQTLWHVWDACRTRGVRLRYDVAAWIGARVADALHHAHEFANARGSLGIVHRDVNPSNVFITYDGRVKVIDFGIARIANRVSEMRGGMKGKVAYMSPEQAAGRMVDRRTDVFALGTTLWEVTTDQRLFRAETEAETLERVATATVPNPTELVEGYPNDLWEVLRRALQRDPNARYRDAAQMSVALDRVSLSEGRAVDESVMSGIMNALFEDERAMHDRWVSDTAAGAETAMLRPERASEALIRMDDVPRAPPSVGRVLSSRDFSGGLPESSANIPLGTQRSSSNPPPRRDSTPPFAPVRVQGLAPVQPLVPPRSHSRAAFFVIGAILLVGCGLLLLMRH